MLAHSGHNAKERRDTPVYLMVVTLGSSPVGLFRSSILADRSVVFMNANTPSHLCRSQVVLWAFCILKSAWMEWTWIILLEFEGFSAWWLGFAKSLIVGHNLGSNYWLSSLGLLVTLSGHWLFQLTHKSLEKRLNGYLKKQVSHLLWL